MIYAFDTFYFEDYANTICLSFQDWGDSEETAIYREKTNITSAKLGISFIQYVKMMRIILAMELLKDTNLSMSEIAYEIGYSNVSAFSNTFQQLTNMRPTEFKAML
jgi:AraC-like DNA-binding protein